MSDTKREFYYRTRSKFEGWKMTKETKRDEAIKQLIKLGYGNTKEEVEEYLLMRAIDDCLRAALVNVLR